MPLLGGYFGLARWSRRRRLRRCEQHIETLIAAHGAGVVAPARGLYKHALPPHALNGCGPVLTGLGKLVAL